MIALRFLLLFAGVALISGAALVIVYDLSIIEKLRRLRGGSEPAAPKPQRAIRLQLAAKLTAVAVIPLLLGLSIVVVPDGSAGVRVSQFSGVKPGSLNAGAHFVVPLVERVEFYDLRDHVYTSSAPDTARKKGELLQVQAREGLQIGLAVAVRYRLDAQRLDSIHANLAQPLESEVVAPVVDTVFRQVAPNYLVKEVFATKREELRRVAAEAITARLKQDGIVVKEVLLRDVQLPAEYVQGLEGLLLNEQENERMATQTEIMQKKVKIAELDAEAQKIRQVKSAEAQAQVRVLQARAESDAMQYTLPLKQKQIEQTKLESEARKQATIKDAEASAEAKVIDGKAESERSRLRTDVEANHIRVTAAADAERQRLMADADANRIRVTSAADSERMKLEAAVLKINPLLIQKIIAERLSDKLQIMMVPSDGKFFFTNDVMRSAFAPGGPGDGQDPDPPAPGMKQNANRNGAATRKPGNP
jgi:regulator of protease activity HflC (stomatin/prohibitin superfamily)